MEYLYGLRTFPLLGYIIANHVLLQLVIREQTADRTVIGLERKNTYIADASVASGNCRTKHYGVTAKRDILGPVGCPQEFCFSNIFSLCLGKNDF